MTCDFCPWADDFQWLGGEDESMKHQRDYVIHTSGLTKQFGSEVVVNALDLRVPGGAIYGFLGPNGSGKSTTMKMLLGLMRPTAGEIHLFGQRLETASRAALLRTVGSMIEAPPGYGHLSGWENMQIVQTMLGLETRQIEEALDTVRLSGHRKKVVKNYSLGMKQRLGIAMALARNPELLILDEPVNGLDPAGIEEIRELIIDLAARGITIMVSSHLLDEVDKTATMMGIIDRGSLIFQGSREELYGHSVPDLIVTTDEQYVANLLRIPGARRHSSSSVAVPGLTQPQAAQLIAEAAQSVPVYEAKRAQQSLEEIFMDLTATGQLR